jgi:hypothetical protein
MRNRQAARGEMGGNPVGETHGEANSVAGRHGTACRRTARKEQRQKGSQGTPEPLTPPRLRKNPGLAISEKSQLRVLIAAAY